MTGNLWSGRCHKLREQNLPLKSFLNSHKERNTCPSPKKPSTNTSTAVNKSLRSSAKRLQRFENWSTPKTRYTLPCWSTSKRFTPDCVQLTRQSEQMLSGILLILPTATLQTNDSLSSRYAMYIVYLLEKNLFYFRYRPQTAEVRR